MLEGVNDFFKQVSKEVERDIDDIMQEVAIFVDRQVIKQKFDQGFKGQGHILTKKTIISPLSTLPLSGKKIGEKRPNFFWRWLNFSPIKYSPDFLAPD